MHLKTLLTLVAVSSFTLSARATPDLSQVGSLFERQGGVCQNPGFVPCYPAGSTSLGSPDAIQDPMSYLNSMTLSGISGLSARDLMTKRQNALCCNPAVQCKVLSNYNIPFCYDPNSTAFAFSDGSGGVAATGETFDAQGNTLNLYTGDYKLANGTQGNYYKERNLPVPNTSTLKITQATQTASTGSSSTRSASGANPTVPSNAFASVQGFTFYALCLFLIA